MPRLDRPCTIYFATVTANQRGTGFNWVWSSGLSVWGDVTDAGSTYDATRGGVRPISILNLTVRWSKVLAKADANLIAVTFAGDANSPPVDGSELDLGDAWRVVEKSILEQSDRRRFIGLRLTRDRFLQES